jgi:hypothetical protein
MPLKPIKIRTPIGVHSPATQEARKRWTQKIVAGRPPCDKCKARQRKLIGVLCTACSNRIGQWGHHESSPPPKLYDLVPETELIQQIIRMNREALKPAADFFDNLLESAKAGVCPLDPRISVILIRLKEVGATGEDLFTAFTAPFANLYLERKWQGKIKPLIRSTKDDENAKCFGAHLVLKFTSMSAATFVKITGGMRKELARYVLANIAPLVYMTAKACKATMEKRAEIEKQLSGVVLQIPN